MMRKEPIRRCVYSGPPEKPNRDSVEPTAFEGLVDQVECQRRNENATPKSHDAGDRSLWYAGVEANQRTDHKSGASQQSPQQRSQQRGMMTPFRRGSHLLLLAATPHRGSVSNSQ
jgi:hypothetical protein